MNDTSHYDFTVIVPVFNEEDNIFNLEKELAAFLPNSLYHTCVLFVNDGSQDGSLPLIEKVCDCNPDFFFLSFAFNCGLSAAIKAGFDYAESPYVGYMDADLQTVPQDFNLLLPFVEQYSLVTGIRANRQDNWSKRMQSKIANAFRHWMTKDGAKDTGCPLKVLQTSCAKQLPLFKGMHRFLPALVLLQTNSAYKQVPVRHFPRTQGQSKFHLSNRLISPLIDCFIYRWMKRRYINYHVSQEKLHN